MEVALTFLAALAAGMSNGQRVINLTPTVIFPIAWVRSKNRKQAFLVAFLYYLAASRGLYISAAVFFEEKIGTNISGTVLWLSSAVSLSLPWVVLFAKPTGVWCKTMRDYAARLFLIIFLLTVPPLGIWGWANPLNAAGYIFPGTGYLGFLFLILIWAAAGVLRGRKAILLAAVLLITGTYIIPVFIQPKQPKGWAGVNTGFDRLASGSDDTASIYDRYKWLYRETEKYEDVKYVVLPETVAGMWSDTTEFLWQPLTKSFKERGRTYIVGAEQLVAGSGKYYNVAQIRGANVDMLRQRIPVPISMYRPWDKNSGAIAAWDERRVTMIDGKRIAILICYEPYLMLPPLVSFSASPEILIAISNSWWSKGSSLPALSDQTVKGWSLLFNVPYVISRNM